MLNKVSVVDKIEILEKGNIQIRVANKILENGKEIAKTYHRRVVCPGDNIDNENEQIKSHAKIAWTDKVIKEYKDKEGRAMNGNYK